MPRFLTVCFLSTYAAFSQTSVLTYHNDNARTGQNTAEAVLTPQNVNSTQFGKIVSVALDGYVHAQPLVLTNVNLAGQGVHDVLYVATENDSIYGLDAYDGTVLWKVNFLSPSSGVTTIPTSDLSACTDVGPQIGITGTPVIDPSSGTLYAVAATKENGNYVQRLHALDVATHAEKFGGPVVIQATAGGTGVSSQNGWVYFDPLRSNQRPGLLLTNGLVVIAWGSHCDGSPYHGWIMAYGASTLVQQAAITTTPNGAKGGVWMGGGGIAADSNGNLYVPTGDGDYDGATNWSDSVLRLSSSSLTVSDFFTPYNQAYMQTNNRDLGSSGLVLLPNLPSGRQLAVLGSKLNTIYLIDRNNLGKYCSGCTSDQIVQEMSGAITGMFNTPAYWNNNVYFVGSGDYVKQFSFNAGGTGLLSTSPVAQSAATIPYPGSTPSISANGTSAGIVWALDNSSWGSSCCQVLHAYDATNVASELYNTSQAASSRDVPSGEAIKFNVPTVANGRVYVASQGSVTIYGLLGSNTATAPTFSPAAGTYSSSQSVVISDSSTGATIYYTTDGSTPTTSSAVYSSPISVATTTTVKAMASGGGFSASAVSSATYTIQTSTTPSATPVISPASGTYSTGQSITIADSSPGVAIYYTTNGNTPTTSSSVYSAPIRLNRSMTVKAMAAGGGFSQSAVASANYTLKKK